MRTETEKPEILPRNTSASSLTTTTCLSPLLQVLRTFLQPKSQIGRKGNQRLHSTPASPQISGSGSQFPNRSGPCLSEDRVTAGRDLGYRFVRPQSRRSGQIHATPPSQRSDSTSGCSSPGNVCRGYHPHDLLRAFAEAHPYPLIPTLQARPRSQPQLQPVEPQVQELPSPLLVLHASGSSPPDALHSPPRPPLEAHASLAKTEVYVPAHLWDSIEPSERYPCLSDLTAHLGDQLPLPLVKLIARDVLRALLLYYSSQREPQVDFDDEKERSRKARKYGQLSQTTILLSPTDRRALISQLRAESHISLATAEIIVFPDYLSSCDDSVFEDGSSCRPVFTLKRSESNDTFGFEFPSAAYEDDLAWQAVQPPEVILDASRQHFQSADMWTLGCILFELITGRPLFDPAFQTQRAVSSKASADSPNLGLSSYESHLIQMMELFGDIPADLVKQGHASGEWFSDDGTLKISTTYYPIRLLKVLEKHVEEDELIATSNFLESLLRLRPAERGLASELIDHAWFIR